jgi:hypothetical protein
MSSFDSRSVQTDRIYWMKFPLLAFLACLLSACAGFHSRANSNPHLTSGESRLLCAVIEAGEEGGYGAYAMGITNYPYRVAKAMSGGYRDPKLIFPVLIASNHTDAASAEMQTDILAAVLQSSGDAAFSTALREVDAPSRRMSALLLQKLFQAKVTPRSMSLPTRMYPETFSIVRMNAAY